MVVTRGINGEAIARQGPEIINALPIRWEQGSTLRSSWSVRTGEAIPSYEKVHFASFVDTASSACCFVTRSHTNGVSFSNKAVIQSTGDIMPPNGILSRRRTFDTSMQSVLSMCFPADFPDVQDKNRGTNVVKTRCKEQKKTIHSGGFALFIWVWTDSRINVTTRERGVGYESSPAFCIQCHGGHAFYDGGDSVSPLVKRGDIC